MKQSSINSKSYSLYFSSHNIEYPLELCSGLKFQFVNELKEPLNGLKSNPPSA